MQVTGFSVGGRVVDGNNMGVDGVKVIVDGQEKSITDKEGYYKLDQVKLLHETYHKSFTSNVFLCSLEISLPGVQVLLLNLHAYLS